MEFPELKDKELEELKAKVAQYEAILRQHDLLDTPVTISIAEQICLSQLEKYNEACKKGGVLTLEEVKIVDFMVKNLLLARGKTPPVEDKKKKKEDKVDLGKLLSIAGEKIDE